MSFFDPWWLLALTLVPLALLGMVVAIRRRGRLAGRYADPSLVRVTTPGRVRGGRAVAAALLALALAASSIALARPYVEETE